MSPRTPLRTLLALPALVALAAATGACNQTPTDAPPATTALSDALSPIDAPASLRSAPPPMLGGIENLIASWEAAWASMDAVAYASHYAPDVDFVNPLGAVVSGREAIAQAHTFLFNPVNGPFRGSVSASTLRRIVPLSGDQALVDLTVDLTGYQGMLPPGLTEWQPGIVRTRARLIVERVGGAWQISSQQLTAVLPMPPS